MPVRRSRSHRRGSLSNSNKGLPLPDTKRGLKQLPQNIPEKQPRQLAQTVIDKPLGVDKTVSNILGRDVAQNPDTTIHGVSETLQEATDKVLPVVKEEVKKVREYGLKNMDRLGKLKGSLQRKLETKMRELEHIKQLIKRCDNCSLKVLEEKVMSKL